MNDTLSWTLSGFIAGLALLSLTATGAEQPHAAAPKLHLAALAAIPGSGPADNSNILADAYFDLARGEAKPSDFDDWYVRHQMTLKGIAAQRGETPLPEDPATHGLRAKDKALLAVAQRSLGEWHAYLDRNQTNAGSAILPLFAALQARYDWWLLSAEAGAPQTAIDAARLRYDDLRAALLAAAQQSRIATL